ncbi:MAG: septal ring lytic transglycosylase RlpA family protein [Geobacteraceae bacterium]|nr:septal ring lytic transglycosylase RlpA family protein [Geobacteraceae bacterium]
MFRIISAILVICLLAACGGHGKKAYRSAPSEPGKAGQRPYTINGERYEPLSSHEGFVQSGIASWYGSDFHGRTTSNGEVYDMHAMTAAHKTLPLGVYVKVRNRDNGREAVVRINDRGPFVAGRIIDLSYSAAKVIGIVGSGTTPVRIEALGYLDETVKGRTAYRAPASYDRGAFGIQVGAFGNPENARRLAESVKQRHGVSSIREALVNGVRFYRVRTGSYASLKAAEKAHERATDKVISEGFVVALD